MAYSITSKDLIGYFESLDFLPNKLHCDNGPEMTLREFLDWAHRRKIEIEYIQPGKPVQNAFIESFSKLTGFVAVIMFFNARIVNSLRWVRLI